MFFSVTSIAHTRTRLQRVCHGRAFATHAKYIMASYAASQVEKRLTPSRECLTSEGYPS